MNWLGWVKSKLKTKIGKKCIFECKHDCPKSMYIEFGLGGLIAYQSTCEHNHEKTQYNLPVETDGLKQIALFQVIPMKYFAI